MGVRHLETFIKTVVVNGVHEDVSIEEICREYQNKNDKKPTLVIDLMGMVSLLRDGREVILCGEQHNLYQKRLEKFMSRLAAVANLVFFLDGPVVQEKYQTWIDRRNGNYRAIVDVIKEIDKGVHVLEIAAPVVKLLLLSGRKHRNTDTKCDPSVLAVIANDSDFLIFSGDWRYLSLKDINPEELTTLEYDRVAFHKCLGLNKKQLKILSTIAGNDVMAYDEVRKFHERTCGHDCRLKFPWLANYIKTKLPKKLDAIVDAIARDVMDSTSQDVKKNIYDSMDQYNTNFKVKDFSESDPLLHLCYLNHYSFCFETLQQIPQNFTLAYCDLEAANVSEVFSSMEIFRKQFGILLQHKNDSKLCCEIWTKRNHVEKYQRHLVEPIYPVAEVPSLLELLNRRKHPEHDAMRFELLKWMVDEEKLKDLDLRAIPRKYFLDILLLVWLKRNNLITTREADLILLTIKNVELDFLPPYLLPPPVLNERAFRVSYLFVVFHSVLEVSLEVTGLKTSMTKILNFDGVFFHQLFLEDFKNRSKFSLDQRLKDLEMFRLYK